MTNSSDHSKNSNSPDAIAKQFLQLWQNQLDASMRNPDAISQMFSNMQNMATNSPYTNPHTPFTSPEGHKQDKAQGKKQAQHDNTAAQHNEKTDTRTPAASVPSVSTDGNATLFQLEQRLATCEERIADLESKLARTSK